MKAFNKVLHVLLTFVMIISMLSVNSQAAETEKERITSIFPDMPDNWSTAALENAVNNGLLIGSNGKIMPNDSLTRAQMAMVIVRAFAAVNKGDLGGFSDVKAIDWYADSMAKAYSMDVIKGYNGNLNPNDSITRQEVFAVIARAFKLKSSLSIDKEFTDVDEISDWAKGEVYAVVNAGYAQGADGKLNPKALITRAEFAQILDNLIKQYIQTQGVVTIIADGNIMINTTGVVMENLTVKGDLIIGDGVDDGEVTLNNVNITGRLVVRSGRVIRDGEEIDIDDEEIPEGGPIDPNDGGNPGGEIPSVIPVTAIIISPTEMLVTIDGGVQTIVATVSPVDATNKNVIWSSSDEGIITVDNTGKITPVTTGTATITATSDANKEITATTEIIVAHKVHDALSLESAIENAKDKDVIYLAAGEYVLKKTLSITKSITILGPQANIDPRESENSTRNEDKNEAILTGDQGDKSDPTSQQEAKEAGWLASIFEIKADNVVINGLTLERTYDHIMYSQTADPEGGDNRNYDITGLKIVNNIVRHGRGNEGIKIGRSINALVQYNYIYDILSPGDAIEAYDVKGFRILDNEVDGGQSTNGNIRVSNKVGGEPGVIRGNLIKNTGYHFAINVENGNGHIIIDNNRIINAATGGIFLYKNSSVSEEELTLIEIINNNIDQYGFNPPMGNNSKEVYLREAASAISVSFNLQKGIQPMIKIIGNTTTNNDIADIPVLCFGGGTIDAKAIPTDLSRVTILENNFNNENVKHIKIIE